MRYRYVPSVKKVSSYDNYPCGFLRRTIVKEDDTIDCKKLFLKLSDTHNDVSGNAFKILLNAEFWEIADYNDYDILPRSITEIIVFNADQKIIKALYTTVVGAGDDHWAVIGDSLLDLAALLKTYSQTSSDTLVVTNCKKLNDLLTPVTTS